MQSVERCHYIGVFHFASFVGEREEGLSGESHYLGGIVEVYLLAFHEAVYDVLHWAAHLVLVFRGGPAEYGAVVGPDNIELLYMLGRFLVDEWEFGLQGQPAVILLVSAVA